MPNWCYSSLHVSGEPEIVDEFRTAVAQSYDGARTVFPSTDVAQTNDVVRQRKYGDLMFGSICPRKDFSGETNVNAYLEFAMQWGTKSELYGDAWLQQSLDRRPVAMPPLGRELVRHLNWGFDTAWSPPCNWVNEASRKFPGLVMTLGYAESGNGIFGVTSCGGAESEEVEFDSDRCMTHAAALARAAMPGKQQRMKQWRQLGALLNGKRGRLPDSDIAGALESGAVGSWPLLMYAARAGAEEVASRCLGLGADPLWRSSAGTGILDVVLDVYSADSPELVHARMAILRNVLREAPELARRPLVSGLAPGELAARFSMVEAATEIALRGGLYVTGRLDGMLSVAAHSMPADDAVRLIRCLGQEERSEAVRKLALGAIERRDADLYMGLWEFNEMLGADARRLALSVSPRNAGDGDKAREFLAVARALEARHAAERACAVALPAVQP